MTTFADCIAEGVARGAITPELGASAHQAYQGAYAEAAQTMSADDADRTAGKAVLTALEKAKLEARRQQLLAVRNRRTILGQIAEQKARRGYSGVKALTGRGDRAPPKGPGGRWDQGGTPPKSGPFRNGGVAARVLPLLLRNKAGRSGWPGLSAEGQALAVKGLFDAKLADVMEKFALKAGTFYSPNRALLGNVVREAFGEETGDAAAKALAKAWGDTAELARQMFNESGGTIGKLADWGLPQSHDAAAIYKAGKARWIAFTAPLLDRTKMVDKLTGAPVTAERLTAPDGLLSRIHDRILTKGLIDKFPPEHPGGGALAMTRGEERFLVFKGADNWTAYQREFGQGDAYQAMIAHLDGMGQDIGLMRTLGPNPEAQFRWLKAFASREAQIERMNGAAGAVTTATRAIDRAQSMFDHYTGKASVPIDERMARWGATIRSYLNGADLGGAILSDMPSAPVFGAMARSFMGVKFQGDIGQFAGLLLDPAVRADARRMGFINEVARDGLVGVTQDSLRSMTAGEKTLNGMNVLARKLPSAVMRAQGLTGSFEARRRSFRMSFMGALADASQKTLPDLAAGSSQERALAAELGNRSFTPADWDAVRATPAWTPRPGVKFLRPVDIADHAGQDLALRVGEMVMNGEQLAVPVSGSLWTRSALTMGNPGTPMGELTRSFFMFKTFLVNTAYQYGEELFLRNVARYGGGIGAYGATAAHAAGIMGMLTVSGAVSLQLKRLARGEDPLPMNTPQFWGAAMLQGGGLGIVGDFLFSQTARNDKGPIVTSFGPTGQLVSDALDLTTGELGDVLYRRQHPGSRARDQEVSRLAHDASAYIPFASLWWARLAFNRAVVDQLEQAMDPDAKERYARAARQAQRQSGAGDWWARGALLPERAPDLQTVAGAPPPP